MFRNFPDKINMEIMKVFSSWENEDERLYSVLMNEEELKLFSSDVLKAKNSGVSDYLRDHNFSESRGWIKQSLIRGKDGKKYDVFTYPDGSTKKVEVKDTFSDDVLKAFLEKTDKKRRKEGKPTSDQIYGRKLYSKTIDFKEETDEDGKI